jgi:hypothetical protein
MSDPSEQAINELSGTIEHLKASMAAIMREADPSVMKRIAETALAGLPPPLEAPTLTSLSPNSAVSGDPDFVLHCIGTNFAAASVIRFGPTQDEPTTFVSDTEVTTIVKPSLFAPAVVQVAVHNGDLWSEWATFTFTAAKTKK